MSTIEQVNNEESPFGALEFLNWNHSWNNFKYPTEKELEKVMKLMREAGVAWVRMDFLWDEIEPGPGQFDFEKYDRIVALAAKYNLRILGLLNYSAPWAAENGQWNDPPKENVRFVSYAVEVIRHFKGKIGYWEIWNEPDSATYWNQQDGLKRYTQLLKEVYVAAKQEDPNCKILNGGFANGVASINKLYENGAQGYFDIMNVHSFESPVNSMAIKSVQSFMRLIRKKMMANGDGNKKIWITEIGCPGVSRGKETKSWWMGQNPSEIEQAQWLTAVYTALLKEPAVDKIFWAFFRDTNEHWSTGVDYFGVVRWDFSKKPSFTAYKNCALKWKKEN